MIFQGAAEEMESVTRSEQYRVAKMSEQLVLETGVSTGVAPAT